SAAPSTSRPPARSPRPTTQACGRFASPTLGLVVGVVVALLLVLVRHQSVALGTLAQSPYRSFWPTTSTPPKPSQWALEAQAARALMLVPLAARLLLVRIDLLAAETGAREVPL